MSGGLVAAAKAAKKSGKNIDDSMMQATRKVVAFKNKSLTALGDFAKKGVKVAGAAVAGMTAAFIALDGATEEYRVAQGKLNAGFQAAGFSTDVARKSYRNFYAILGDTDTATEASQLLANMAKNEEEVTKWTRIAAGVHGTFGDSLPIEGLVESANETARTGQITGVFADAINWATKEGEKFGVTLKADTEANKKWNEAAKSASSAEDFFNLALQNCSDESARQKLIVDTLSKTYDKAADSFYANNQQVINARRNHAMLDEMLAKVGDTSSKLKSQLWVLAGAAEDGSIRSGSALDWVQQKTEAFGTWVEGLDLSALKQQFDENFAQGLQKAGDAMDWCREHADGLKTGVKLLAVAFGLVKLAQFNQSVAGGASALLGMGKTVLTMTGVLGGQTAATGAATAAQTGLNAAMSANPIGAVILRIEGAIAVGVLLYKNWDTVKAKAGEVWNSIKTAFGGIRDSITGAFSAAMENVAGFFSWLDQKIESVPILGSIYKGGKNAVSWVADHLDGNAMGTPYWRGGLTRVNERGGEIMNLPSGTQIIPHDVSVKAAGGRSVTVNVNIQGNVIGNREYTEQVGEYVGRKVLAALGNT
jgi:hypothetical protein|nr:MAG TPA: minor tail protein [Caudoviricetes sp.]